MLVEEPAAVAAAVAVVVVAGAVAVAVVAAAPLLPVQELIVSAAGADVHHQACVAAADHYCMYGDAYYGFAATSAVVAAFVAVAASVVAVLAEDPAEDPVVVRVAE